MAAYDLEEQEQLSAMKAWWAQYGNWIAGVAAAIAVAALAWQGWSLHQSRQGAEASALFGQLTLAVERKDRNAIRDLSGQLLSKYGDTTQADLAALLAAKADLDANDVKSAKPRLEHVVDKSDDAMLRDLARLRLAAVLVDEKAYDAALKLLERTPVDAYAGRFADLRGDVLMAKGDKDQARNAYKDALTLLGQAYAQPSAMKNLIETKLEALGGA